MMNEPVIDEVVARRFLLGQLSPEEQGQIEELAFEDPDTFTFLESVGEDLIDEFVHDELSPLERQRFEEHFLTFPGRRQDLEISEALQEHFDSQPEVITAEPKKTVPNDDDRKFFIVRFIDSLKAPNFWLRAITAAAVVALLVIAVWIISRQEERQPDPIQAGPGTPVNVSSPEPRISPSLQPSPSPVQAENKRKTPTPEKQSPVATYATLLVPSAAPRSTGAQSLQLPPDASPVPVGLALVHQTNFKTYDVVLEDEAGTELERWSNLEAQRFPATKGLLINVQTALLKPGEFYRIVVTGITSKGETSILQGYHFEAKK